MSKKEAKDEEFDMLDDDVPFVNTSGMHFIEFEWRVFRFLISTAPHSTLTTQTQLLTQTHMYVRVQEGSER